MSTAARRAGMTARRTDRTARRARPATGLAVAVLALGPTGAATQDANIVLPVDSAETLLADGTFEVVDLRPSRGVEGERTYRATLSFEGGTVVAAQWAPAPPGGGAFNNNPRYELAAYEFQKLFLEPSEYVVPPTVVRAFDLEWYRERVGPFSADAARARPTFAQTEAVLVVLQYWLFNVGGDREEFWDEDRFATDTLYARYMANFNIFTHLVGHNDENMGNYLISSRADNPRIFSVDNGLTFGSERSDQGVRWRRLRVDRVPKRTVDRLRQLTEDDVRRQLETLAQWRVEADRTLAAMAPGPPTRPNSGVRVTDRLIQLGLDRGEIRAVWRRIERLLRRVDRGRLETF